MTLEEAITIMKRASAEHGELTVKRSSGGVVDTVGFSEYDILIGPGHFGADDQNVTNALHAIGTHLRNAQNADLNAFDERGGEVLMHFNADGLSRASQRAARDSEFSALDSSIPETASPGM